MASFSTDDLFDPSLGPALFGPVEQRPNAPIGVQVTGATLQDRADSRLLGEGREDPPELGAIHHVDVDSVKPAALQRPGHQLAALLPDEGAASDP